MGDQLKNALLPGSVLVVNDSTYGEISQDPKHVALLEDTHAVIIPFSVQPVANEQLVETLRAILFASQQLAPNALLVKNPYETASYERADHAIEAFASAKYHALANVARLLGAKEVQVKEVKAERQTSGWKVELRAKFPGASGSAETSNEVTKKIEAQLEAVMKFPGGAPAVVDAAEYLVRRTLAHDQQLRDLVEMRSGTNPITHYTVKLSGMRESSANLKSALKIANAGPVRALDIGGSFTRTVQSISNIEITTVVTF
jgi:hypothetical protein